MEKGPLLISLLSGRLDTKQLSVLPAQQVTTSLTRHACKMSVRGYEAARCPRLRQVPKGSGGDGRSVLRVHDEAGREGNAARGQVAEEMVRFTLRHMLDV